jgi:RsiW-degrading membrane proteinase PrsW (M82 family)
VAPPDPTGRIALAASCGVLVLFVGAFMAVCAGLNVLVPFIVQPGWTLASLIVAVSFGLPHIAIILWLDRNEGEPPLLLASAWLWGAVMATGMSMIVNTTFGGLAASLVGDADIAGQLTASFSAPPVEEFTKGAAVHLIYLFFRRNFDNVLDGIVYGALVGMGFAMFENFVYYMGPFLEESPTAVSDWFQLVFLRGIVTGVGTHWCFTALTGAGFGLLRVQRSGCLRYAWPVVGVLLAMFAHFVWNTFTGLFIIDPNDTLLTLLVSVPIAVVFLQAPFVLLVIIVASLTLWHEAVLIRKYLSEERNSVVMPGEIERLVPARRRFFHNVMLLLTFRFSEWWTTIRRNRLLVQLAFARWHMDKEEEAGVDIEAGWHARRVMEIRKLLKLVPAAR